MTTSKNARAVQITGLACLVVAGVARMYVDRRVTLPDGTRDAVVGALYGVTIGINLLAVWMIARRRAQRH